MKITKSELKSIVKECLVEILNEGLGGSIGLGNTILKNSFAATPGGQKNGAVFSEKRSENFRNARNPTQHLHAAIAREAGGNKVMESILADTAASTLPKMLENDRQGVAHFEPTGVAERVVAAASPEDILGEEAASKWANLAFADSTLKNKF